MTDNEIITQALKRVAEMLRATHAQGRVQAEHRLLDLADAQTFERLAEKQAGFNRAGLHATVRLTGDTREWLLRAMDEAREALFLEYDQDPDLDSEEDYNFGWRLEVEGELCGEGDVRGR